MVNPIRKQCDYALVLPHEATIESAGLDSGVDDGKRAVAHRICRTMALYTEARTGYRD